jgi:tetratricopeptide (TPR) repeat protein
MRRSGLWAVVLAAGLALPPAAWAAGPLEVDHPRVAEGRAAYEAGKYEDALAAFEAAKKERPDDPAVEYNRAVSLAQLGRVAEAKESFKRVADSNQPELQQKAWYNLGNVHAGMGERKEALQSYRRALKLDPNDSMARHNYEVVLRNLPPPQQQGGPDGGTDGGSGQDGGRPDAGQDGGQKGDGGAPVDGGTDGGDGGSDAGAGPDGGSDGGTDGGGGDAGSDAGADGGQQGEGQGDGGSDAGTDAGSGEGEGQATDAGADGGTESDEQTEYEVDAGMSPEDIDRQEAERLLDAMKQNEKNLQLWRFQQKKQRKPNEKDW